tara:strand:+ start:380 stop:763 length:384 start_codon:yes stop_codon:yes gene_type:complete
MKNWKKVILLLVVLFPSFFFLSKAFSSNDIYVEENELIIKGAGGVEIHKDDITSIEVIAELPELSGTGGMSLGLIKKGNFIRASDQKEVRVVKNGDGHFIHLTTETMEVYFNLKTELETEGVLSQIN